MLVMRRGKLVIGKHQIFAVLLIAAFVAQCVWVIWKLPLQLSEQDHIWAGRQQLEYAANPRAFKHTPLPNVLAAAALKVDVQRNTNARVIPSADSVMQQVRRMRLFARIPFVLIGIMFAVSIWYVSRRLFGNAGGYITLALFCFSPMMVLNAATVNEVGPSAWGIFGVIFTAIAISHNLYAPWKKWRYRTVLLSLAAAIAITSHPAAMLLIPVALLFMLYLAPGRRLPAIAIIVIVILFAAVAVHFAYGFNIRGMQNGIDMRDWVKYTPAESRAAVLGEGSVFLSRLNPANALMIVVSFVAFLVWGRTRYFGNAAPLMVGGGLLYLALVTPMTTTAAIWAMPFLFVFIGGIWADLIESNRGKWAIGIAVLMIAESAWFSWKMLGNVIAKG